MAAEEVEYESDPEEVKLSLKMRRRAASDDEEEGEEREKPTVRIDSDVESDEQGAAPADYYDEDEYLEEEEEEELEYEDESLGHKLEEEGGAPGGSQVVERMVEGEEDKDVNVDGERLGRVDDSTDADGRVDDGVNEKDDVGVNDNQQQIEEEEKKENEPYAVPTAGAFYMHDDRFRDNTAGRHRRTLGGRRLWESKDDRKWGHDKFEELTSQERQYEEGRRSSRGRFRGRGRSRGASHGYSQGNRPKTFINSDDWNNDDDQNDALKSVRGRGPRRYQQSFKNDRPPMQKKQSAKSGERPSRTSSGRATVRVSNVESSAAPANKQVFASSLNSASPPFYPSSSSSKDITLTQKRDVQAGTVNRNIQAPVVDESYPMAQSNTMMRGKNIVDSVGFDKLYITESNSGLAGKPSTPMQFATSSSSSVNSSQSQHLRGQGRGLNILPQTTYQSTAAGNLGNGVSPPNQLHAVQRNSVQNRVQSSMQASSQQFAQRPGSVSRGSSPPKAVVPINSLESGELESPSELSKSNTGLGGKEKVNVSGSGRGLFLYGGTKVMGPSGNMNPGRGDQNFPGAPTFLPVMQLGGQHTGGIPAVGMAFPGYVGNPQLGLGNSEMTWLPVLAGAAGALGATYCSPYIAVDGAYNARPSGQASTLAAAPSKENNANKPSNEWKSAQRPAEPPNDEFGQRQKNPRRYTEMKFDQ